MSRDNRDRWTFYTHPVKKPLDAMEVRYWKSIFRKILKVGLEFEYNLPNKNGTCKGGNNACPCQHTNTKTCWQTCLRVEACRAEMGKEFKCHGIFCSGFVTACLTCQDYSINCGSCEHRFDSSRNPDSIRERITNELQPSNSYGAVTKYGVHSVVTDGSLLGKKGAEIITVGRRVDYWEFFRMASSIVNLAETNGAYVNERCSIHAHILSSYYGKVPKSEELGPGIHSNINEMERDLPEIVIANFHQLCRRYQNAITWMTTGLDDPNHLTRWEKFRVSVLGTSAIFNNMISVRDEVSGNAGGNKYGWVNYNNCLFTDEGNVRRFHVEMRVMDGLMSPSAIAAISCLYYALVIKAAEISRYGIAEVGDKEWLDRAARIKASLMNNMKGYQDGDRFSDTHDLSKHYETLISESLDLVRQLKHILITVGPAYEILEKLAERPCSLRRCDGQSWNQIEKDLAVEFTVEDLFANKIAEIIDLRLVDECQTPEEWIKEVVMMLRKDSELHIDPEDISIPKRVQQFVDRKRNDGEIIWLEKVGAMAGIL